MKEKTDSSPVAKAEVAAEAAGEYSIELAKEGSKEVAKGTLNGLEQGVRTQVAGKSIKDGVSEMIRDRGRTVATSAKDGAIEAVKDAAKNLNKIGVSVTQDIAFGIVYDKVAETVIPDDMKAKKSENQKELEARAERGELGAKANLFFRGFAGYVLPAGQQIVDGIDNVKAAHDLNLEASIKVSENDVKIKAPPTKAEQDAYNKWEEERKAKLAGALPPPQQLAPHSDTAVPSFALASKEEVAAKLKARNSQEMASAHQPSTPKA